LLLFCAIQQHKIINTVARLANRCGRKTSGVEKNADEVWILNVEVAKMSRLESGF